MVDEKDLEPPIDNNAEPNPKRQEELRAACKANNALGNSPYAGVRILTRGELLWIMQEHDWSGNRLAGGKKRANFNRAILRRLNLKGIYLYEADLSYARLEGADLSDANLGGANLLRADLIGANLSNADVAFAKLTNARLYRAKMNNAHLGGAVLLDANLRESDASGADFRQADLRGADLREIKMDTGTLLASIKISSQTSMGDIIWNGAALVRVDWKQASKLGDEILIANAKTRQERVVAYHNTARAYRGLVIALASQGLTNIASEYRLQEQRLERKSLLIEYKVFSWFFSLLLDLLSGYGERPRRPFFAYLTTIFFFMVLYYITTRTLETGVCPIGWDEALVLSVTSFHGRGFLPGFLALGDWIARIAAIEAVIGLFIELIFIATFSRRFLGS